MPAHRDSDAYEQARETMIERHLKGRGITDERLLSAMAAVPRHEFIPRAGAAMAYSDRPLPIGEGQTISQPYMVAFMVQQLNIQPTDRVLEVGAGSGYQAAVLAELADEGEVYGIEYVPELAEKARRTLNRLGYDNITIVTGDGSTGHEDAAPYDRIIAAAACPEIPPAWKEQLAAGGRIVAPVGSRGTQTCVVLDRTADGLKTERTIGCVFVPLLGEYGFGERR
jgi:protein-L-isoaspartate(D-aspartate) O-methyltransferase